MDEILAKETLLTAQEKVAVDTKLQQLQTTQISYAKLNKKYQYQPKTTIDNIDVEVHELVAPNQETGYIVILYKTYNGELYRCSYGFGRDSVHHTKDWYLYIKLDD